MSRRERLWAGQLLGWRHVAQPLALLDALLTSQGWSPPLCPGCLLCRGMRARLQVRVQVRGQGGQRAGGRLLCRTVGGTTGGHAWGDPGTMHPDRPACLPCKLALHGGCEPRLRCPLLMLLAPHRLSAAGGDAAPKAGRQAGGQGVGAGHARAGEKVQGRGQGRGRHGTKKDGAHVNMPSSLSCTCVDTPTNQPTDCALASPLALPSLPGGAAGRQLHHGHVP